MPLRDGYGFVVGTKARYFRDDPDDFGRFYHGNLIVGTPQGEYRCAIDVDPKNTPDGIEWRVVESERRRHGPVQSIAERIAPACVKPDVGCDGLHPLADAAPADRDHTRALRRFSRLRALDLVNWNPPWNDGTGMDALTDLERVLADGLRVAMFSASPSGSVSACTTSTRTRGIRSGLPLPAENAIWQDGATIIESSSGKFTAFLNKFKDQRYQTDDNGHPI